MPALLQPADGGGEGRLGDARLLGAAVKLSQFGDPHEPYRIQVIHGPIVFKRNSDFHYHAIYRAIKRTNSDPVGSYRALSFPGQESHHDQTHRPHHGSQSWPRQHSALALAVKGVDLIITYRSQADEAAAVVARGQGLGVQAHALALDVGESATLPPSQRR